jgi:hypothetical protein
MKAARIDQPQGLLASIGKENGMADDFAVEINIRFGQRGDAWKSTWYV